MLVRVWRNWTFCLLLIEMHNGTSIKENCLATYIKLNMNLSCNPETPLKDIYPKETKNYVHINYCTQIFIEVLFIISKQWKYVKRHLRCKRINKSQYIDTMKYYIAVKIMNYWHTHIQHTNNLDICQRNHAEWRKPISKGNNIISTIYLFLNEKKL